MGLDLDDPTADEAERGLVDIPQARVVRGDRYPTSAQLFNALAKQATGDFIMPFPDDYTIVQPDWAERIGPQLAALPLSLGVAYLHDPLYPNFSTFPILSRKMVEMAGFFLPPFFPFLFGDTWWNEVGVMSGMIVRCDATAIIEGEAGAVHNYRDLKLWADLFERTRPMREDMAIRMINQACGEGTDHGAYLINTIPERKAVLMRMQAEFQTPEFIEKWNSYGDGFPHPHYDALATKARNFMEMTQ